MIISNNPNLIIHQASFSNTHHQLKSDLRPKAAEKNTGCFRDMLQRVKNIELNKLQFYYYYLPFSKPPVLIMKQYTHI